MTDDFDWANGRKSARRIAARPCDIMDSSNGRPTAQSFRPEPDETSVSEPGWHDRSSSDPPTRILDDGTQEWWANGLRHRLVGPAVIRPNETMKWWVEGRKHRLDGPAVIYDNGVQEWWIDGEEIHLRRSRSL